MRLFSSSLSAIRVVSCAYLRLLIFLPAILIQACASSSPAFVMTYSASVQSFQLLSLVQLFTRPWIAACQASLSITNSRSSLKPTSIESVMPSSHLILCCSLLLLPPIPPSIRVFSNESALCRRWPKYWSFSFSIIPSKEIPGLISFGMDWLDLLAVQETLKSLLQHHSSSTLHINKLINPVTTYSPDILLFLLEPVCCSMSSSNCCFLTCIQISQEAGQVVWYSHLFQNFPQFIVIPTVKGFDIVNKAKIDVFRELSWSNYVLMVAVALPTWSFYGPRSSSPQVYRLYGQIYDKL